MHKPARLLRQALGILLALYPLTVSAAGLWFGDKDGLHQIDTATNQVGSNVAFEPPVGIAVNAADGSVWVLTQKRLARLSEQGVVRFQAALRDLGNGLGAPRLLVLNPNDQSVWAGFENRTLHLDASGVVQIVLPVRAQDLAVGQDGSVWILTQSSLEQRDSAGALMKTVALPGTAARLKFLALDDSGGALWLAGEKELLQLGLANPDQTLRSLLAPETVAGISVDIQTGDPWVIGQNGLFSYSRDGTPHVSRDLRDFSISNPRTLVFDFASQAAWVGHQGGLTRITVDGTVAATFAAAAQVVAISIGRTPINIVPVVSILAPPDGALLNNPTPRLRVGYDALCGAVSCGFPKSFFATFSLSALLNGSEVGSLFVFDPASGSAAFTPGSRLPEGLNTFSAQARDSFGRFSDPVSSSFTIDTIAPSFQNVTPATGSVFSSASITIQGSVNDPAASVTLGAQTQGPSFSFPVTLSQGSNSFTLLARDPAGNTASFPLTYVFEPPNVPPSVTITSPLNGANFTAPASFTVSANASDPDGSIVRVDFFSNGILAGTDTLAPYAVALTNLGAGSYSLTAQATDNRAATVTSAPVNITVGPPNALPAVQMTSPANNTAFSAPATVQVAATASDADGTIAKVEFFRNGVLAAMVTTPPYAATLTGVPAGTHTLSARATDDRGGATTSAPVTITVTATSLTLTSPAANAVIAGNTVLVTGRIVALANSGVNVNDNVAAIDASGNFSVLVPVTAGLNTLTATLTTIDGTIITRSVSVTASGLASPFAVVADPTTGLAPLPVTYTVSNPTAGNATFTFDGFGPFFLPAGATAQLSITFPAGVFVDTVVFTDGGGATFTHRLVIDSRDQAQMDQMFHAIWNGMNNALAAGDKEGAMRYLSDTGRQKFGPVFDVLMPFMPSIVASYSPLARASISAGIGEYAVTRLEGSAKRLYLIYFLRDVNGVWRIDEM
jgi:hypothetical protein